MTSASQRLETCVEHSALYTILVQSRSHSTALRAGRSTVRGLPNWIEHSTTVRALHRVADAWEFAALNRARESVRTWTRSSSLYAWLTKEPEAEVIVIDLRATYTVGPVIAALDRSHRALAPAYRRSRLRTLSIRTARTLNDAPIRAASLVVLY